MPEAHGRNTRQLINLFVCQVLTPISICFYVKGSTMAEVAEEFAASLSDLTVNSKPHINMLTMLADDHHDYAVLITQTVLNHLQKVNIVLIFYILTKQTTGYVL